ncbi:putative aldouronate transport system permease protein [Bacillus sp. 3255]|nr:putative aldouronate transport system permease protein [Bacillus sp. 3255]
MITRNTILYNFAFIVLGLVAAVTLAICLVELTSRRLSRMYQTAMLMPYFLSWIIVSYFVFSFLSSSKGLLNQLMRWLGLESIYWYNEPKYWPYLFIIIYLWKFVGYNSVMYLAAIMGIDRSLYEAAMIDGAGKWKQILHITLPQLSTLMTILTLLAVGKIFYADFGLFYQVPRNSGLLYSTTNVIDTFVYRGLKTTGEIGMSTAAGFYQSVVGFVLVLLSNNVVRKLNKDNALF